MNEMTPKPQETPDAGAPLIASNFRAVWTNLSVAQRAGALVVTLLTFGALLFIAMSASGSDYQTLYSGLTPEQSAEITQALAERQIPYDLHDDATVRVPSDLVHEARVQLAGAGLPSESGSGRGFELFDENEFGMTAFTQKVNYQRAMEAELARTIRHLRAVEAARVHLVIPERTLFKEDARAPTASVILSIKPGQQVDQAGVRAIRHMVASSVEGLDARDITLVDEGGELLAAPRQSAAALAELGGGGGGEGESRRAAMEMEQQLKARVLALLAPIVGPRGARVEAHVQLDGRRVSETSERFDPERTAVRREQKSEEKRLDEGAEVGGLTGAAAQLDGAGAAAQDAQNARSMRSSEATEYEIDKTVRQVIEGGSRIERLSVAVLLDERVLNPSADLAGGDEAAEAGGEGATEAATEAAAASVAPDLEQLEALVAGAIGFDAARGDRLELSMQPFQPLEANALAPIPFYQEPAFVQATVRYALLALVALLLIVFVARPLIKSLSAALTGEPRIALEQGASQQLVSTRTVNEPELLGRSVAEVLDQVEDGVHLELSSIDPVYEHQKRLRAELLALTSSDYDRASEVISQWLRMDAAEEIGAKASPSQSGAKRAS